ncbi:hypothetical protein LWI28_005653 [Acer negundo]|uniref:Uncharacterized protein n=1 Tax=Acer negundo TaxID=4023 RepID=A0AAD5JHY9_ACENE|nr:hypothetical protein LWI28_005653 [Acer negundo]
MNKKLDTRDRRRSQRDTRVEEEVIDTRVKEEATETRVEEEANEIEEEVNECLLFLGFSQTEREEFVKIQRELKIEDTAVGKSTSNKERASQDSVADDKDKDIFSSVHIFDDGEKVEKVLAEKVVRKTSLEAGVEAGLDRVEGSQSCLRMLMLTRLV